MQGSYEVAAIDLPGYNASSAPARRSDYVSGTACAAVADVLEALGRESCVLVGHDWGGALAFDFAALHPSKVDKLAVLAAPPTALFIENMDGAQLSKSKYMYVFTTPKLAELLLSNEDYGMVETMFTDTEQGGMRRRTLPAADVARYKDAIARPGALTAALNYYRCAACLPATPAVHWHANWEQRLCTTLLPDRCRGCPLARPRCCGCLLGAAAPSL